MIKKLKKLVREVLLKFNINIYLLTSLNQINTFLKFFEIKIPNNIDLIRVGSKNDGGYLVPNILNQIKFCYSAGIGNSIKFEKDLLKYKIISFGADRTIENIPEKIFQLCKGTISAALAMPSEGKLLLFSNNGSLYVGKIEGAFYFTSERYPLELLGCTEIQ